MPLATDINEPWTSQLDDLLTGRGMEPVGDTLPGAQLTIHNTDGTLAYSAALARHWRPDPDQPNLIWIRPITPPTTNPITDLPEFDPTTSRRRALDITTVHTTPTGLTLHLTTDQTAHIHPATGPHLDTLQHWDTWTTTIPTTLRAELETLAADS